MCLAAPGTAVIKETNGDQVSILKLTVSKPYILFNHLDDQPPLKWARNKKCADAALIVESEGGVDIHIVELKSKLTVGEWSKARLQFEGMIFNARALVSVIEVQNVKSITCHISYVRDAINPSETDDPVLLKLPLGELGGLGGAGDWFSGRVRIDGLPEMNLFKWQRDVTTNEANGVIPANP